MVKRVEARAAAQLRVVYAVDESSLRFGVHAPEHVQPDDGEHDREQTQERGDAHERAQGREEHFADHAQAGEVAEHLEHAENAQHFQPTHRRDDVGIVAIRVRLTPVSTVSTRVVPAVHRHGDGLHHREAHDEEVEPVEGVGEKVPRPEADEFHGNLQEKKSREARVGDNQKKSQVVIHAVVLDGHRRGV